MLTAVNKSWAGLILGFGLIAISFASIFIKLCSAPALVIASYRLTIASLFYLGATRIKSGPIWATFSPPQRKLAVLSGLFLALHFATWITSLKFTSVVSSVVLVQSSPVFVALGSFLLLKERLSVLMVVGILITFGGGLFIAAHDFSVSQSSLTGNLLAVGGAIGAAGYFLVGRKLRASIDTLRYVSAVYSAAALALLVLTGLSGASFFGYSFKDYLLFAAIAMIPQVIGHTSLNWALKYFSATAVAVITLGEPIGAALLAFAILGEPLGLVTIAGAAVILSGVVMVLFAEGREYSRSSNV